MDRVPLSDLPLAIRRGLPHNSPQLDDFAAEVEQRYGLPPGWLRAVKNAGERSESGSVSPKGARGVMQFIPGTAERYGLKDPTDPLAAIEAAGKYGADLNAQFHGDPVLMAGGYNAGEAHPGLKDPSKLPEETRAYMERIRAAMPSVAPRTWAAGDPVPAEDLPSEGARETARLKGATRQEQIAADRKLYTPVNPNPFMSALEGAGKSAQDTWDFIRRPSQEETDERAALDVPLMGSTSGLLGNVVGQGAQIAMPASWLARGAGGLRALSAAARTAAAGAGPQQAALAVRALTAPAAQAATVGGGYAATQPVTSDTSRAWNAGEGALAALAGHGLVKATRAVVVPAWDRASEGVADLAKLAMDKYGIPLRASQISDSPTLSFITSLTDALPFSGAGKKLGAQVDAVTDQLNKTMGQAGPNLTEGLRKARDSLDSTYKLITGRNSAVLTPTHITAMARAANAVKDYDTTPTKSVMTSLHDLIDSYIRTADPVTGEVPGTVYQSWRKDLKDAAMNTNIPAKAVSAYKVFRQQLDDAFRSGVQQSGNPEDYALLGQTDKRWANMRTLENLVPKGAEDAAPDISRLATVLRGRSRANSGNRDAALYGSGDQTLTDLSRIGSEFINGEAVTPKSVLGRLKKPLLTAGEVGGAAGGLYALNHKEETPVMDTAADLAKLFIATKLGGAALNSRWFAHGIPGGAAAADLAQRYGAAQLLPNYVRAASGAVPATPPADESGAEVPLSELTGGV